MAKSTNRRNPQVAVSRELRARHRKLLLAAIVAWVGIVFAVTSVHPDDWFAVSKVSVQGNLTYLTPEQVFAEIEADARGGFFSVDTWEIHRKVVLLPWVHKVTVRRVWPDSLHVRVVEQEPVAVWRDGRLMNTNGELFSVPVMPANLDLPLLSGPQGSERLVMRKYRDLRVLLASVTPAIRSLHLDERRAWSLQLANDLELNIGRDFKARKIERFVRYYPQLFAGHEQGIASLDLRYTNGISVRWKPGVGPDTKRAQDVEES